MGFHFIQFAQCGIQAKFGNFKLIAGMLDFLYIQLRIATATQDGFLCREMLACIERQIAQDFVEEHI